ncbi:MAG: GC-type dockerin domain-anchored protein [Planctomycetota bacterium]
MRLSHSVDEGTITPGVGAACTTIDDPSTGRDNSFWRGFFLPDFGVDDSLRVTRVEFGVETLALPTLGEADIAINLYSPIDWPMPPSSFDLVGSTTITLTERSLDVVAADIHGVVQGGWLVVEVAVPDFSLASGGLTGDVFIPGANSAGQTAPSYVSSDGCGLPEPTDFADIALPDTHLVISVEGEQFICRCCADFDRDGQLTIFDFLAFQTYFAVGDSRADLDRDGELTIFDFLQFQNYFIAGCP